MTPRHPNHQDESILQTQENCKSIHDGRNKFAMWVVGLFIVLIIALSGAAWAFISGEIRRGAEHEIRIQHLETTVQKIDRMDDKLTDIRRIADELNRKK